MRRDFSEESKQKLLELVKEVEAEKWSALTDWFGDRWYDFEEWIGVLDIKRYLDDVSSYHKKVIDKENYAAYNIETIYQNVNADSERYQSRFAALLTALQGFRDTMEKVSAAVGPGKGYFDSKYIGTELKYAVNTYLEESRYLQTMSMDGLTEDDIIHGGAAFQALLARFADTMLKLLPAVKIGSKLEIPIGPGTTLYYKVSGKVDGPGDGEIDLVIENQKLEFEKFKYTKELSNDVKIELDSKGKAVMKPGSQNATTEFGTSLGGEYERTIGANTYKYRAEFSFIKNEFVIEESVTTNLEGGSVTSAVGIKCKGESNGWKPVPVPVPEPSPVTVQIPSFDVDWETVAVVAVSVVTIAAICFFAPEALPVVALAL